MKKFTDWIPLVGLYTFFKNDNAENPIYGSLWSVYTGIYLAIGLLLVTGVHTVRQEYVVDPCPTIRQDASTTKASFSEEMFDEELGQYNWKFPDIVKAQAILESANFKSKIFMEKNNAFGMRIAKSRLTTANIREKGYARYKDWRLGIADRALFEQCCMRNLKTKEVYYGYLDDNYASMDSSSYSMKLKEIVVKLKGR